MKIAARCCLLASVFVGCGPVVGDDDGASAGGTTSEPGTSTSVGSGASSDPETSSAATSSTTNDDSGPGSAVTSDSSASATATTTTTTTSTTDPTAAETGPRCAWEDTPEVCEELFCVAINGYPIVEGPDGPCISQRPELLGCVECYAFEGSTYLCKDAVIYQVPGFCPWELEKYEAAGYTECAPPPVPLELCP